MFSGKLALESRGALYAVFDDIRGGIKFFPGFKDWLGCQSHFLVKAMYKDPVMFHWNRPCIWVSNTDPRHDMESADVAWMEVNCVFVEVSRSIFRANTE